MKQRVMIAIAIAQKPAMLLADEPTTALDVTIQDQILTLLASLQAESGMSIVIVSHDLNVIAQSCDQLAVMYAGRVVEYGQTDEVLEKSRHPYTRALIEAVPAVKVGASRARLAAIGGQPPDLTALTDGCSFAPRCRHADPGCATAPMDLDRPVPAHGSACLYPEKVGPHGA
jgi:peptide/nickel transport system ATP-binding protein/oligopeptide transport system ATP-binding protein